MTVADVVAVSLAAAAKTLGAARAPNTAAAATATAQDFLKEKFFEELNDVFIVDPVN
jgi:hypothetical protein